MPWIPILWFPFSFRKLRKGRSQKVLLNLALALLCANIIFLVGIERTENYEGCLAVAALLHFFLLAGKTDTLTTLLSLLFTERALNHLGKIFQTVILFSFFAAFAWMLVEGVLQYLKFVKVMDTYVDNFMLKASIPAWGTKPRYHHLSLGMFILRFSIQPDSSQFFDICLHCQGFLPWQLALLLESTIIYTEDPTTCTCVFFLLFTEKKLIHSFCWGYRLSQWRRAPACFSLQLLAGRASILLWFHDSIGRHHDHKRLRVRPGGEGHHVRPTQTRAQHSAWERTRSAAGQSRDLLLRYLGQVLISFHAAVLDQKYTVCFRLESECLMCTIEMRIHSCSLSQYPRASCSAKPTAVWTVTFLAGLTWVFGFLAIEDARIVFQYLFCIFNAFQGFFIFVLHNIREPSVRQAWRNCCCRGK